MYTSMHPFFLKYMQFEKHDDKLHLPLISVAVWTRFYQRFGDLTMSREPAMAKVEKMILAKRNRGSNTSKSVFQ